MFIDQVSSVYDILQMNYIAKDRLGAVDAEQAKEAANISNIRMIFDPCKGGVFLMGLDTVIGAQPSSWHSVPSVITKYHEKLFLADKMQDERDVPGEAIRGHGLAVTTQPDEQPGSAQ